jgi:hypothetical protein
VRLVRRVALGVRVDARHPLTFFVALADALLLLEDGVRLNALVARLVALLLLGCTVGLVGALKIAPSV